jgi:regulatory protein
MADAYTTALTMLAAREMSAARLRERLARRGFEPTDIDQVIHRLISDRSLDDGRVARAAARLEATVRHRGRRRVLQRVRQMGIDEETAEAAVNEVFGELDESALLERAIERRLKGRSVEALDRRGLARLMRGLAAQGFRPDVIRRRLRGRGMMSDSS